MSITQKTLNDDRQLGEIWELNFETMMTKHNFWCHRLQASRTTAAYIAINSSRVIAPDVIFGRQFQELFGEIKHKSPNEYLSYGLEEYRLNHIQTIMNYARIPYVYIIHDWKDAGGKDITDNNISHWYVQNFATLIKNGFKVYPGMSYYNGTIQTVNICYFPKKNFEPLWEYLWIDI